MLVEPLWILIKAMGSSEATVPELHTPTVEQVLIKVLRNELHTPRTGP